MIKGLNNLPNVETLSNDEIVELLPYLDLIVGWAKSVQDYALRKALEGEKFKGFKVVAGRSNRKWKDEKEVENLLIGEGFDEDIIYEKRLSGITKIENLLGKKKFNDLFGNLVEKPLGKPTLVSEDDPRPHFTPEDSAAEDFK